MPMKGQFEEWETVSPLEAWTRLCRKEMEIAQWHDRHEVEYEVSQCLQARHRQELLDAAEDAAIRRDVRLALLSLEIAERHEARGIQGTQPDEDDISDDASDVGTAVYSVDEPEEEEEPEVENHVFDASGLLQRQPLDEPR